MNYRIAIAVLFLAYAAGSVDACTSLLVTKGASADGSVMITYTADSAGFYPRLAVFPAAEYPDGTIIEVPATKDRPAGAVKQAAKTYHVIGVEWDPEPGAHGGFWTRQGLINEHQVAITETTFGGRPELVDPQGLINYPMLITFALQRAKTAREAIEVMVELVEEYGYNDEGESFSIADKEEAWVFEIVGFAAQSLHPVPEEAETDSTEQPDNLADSTEHESANDAERATMEISRIIRVLYRDLSNFGVGTTDGRKIILSFDQTTPKETVESVAQMVQNLPGVNETFTVWDPSLPPGVLPWEYQNYLLATPITSDDQALALFREGERIFIAGNFHEAKPLLERFVEQRPRDTLLEHVLYYLAKMAWTAGNVEEAAFYGAQSVRLFPHGVRFAENKKILKEAAAQVRLKETHEQGSRRDSDNFANVTKGGVVWVAKKVPDGEISVHANQSRIGEIPVTPDMDNCFYSDNIRSVAIERGWYDPTSGKPFRFDNAYDVITPASKRVCAARVWSIFCRAAPSQEFSPDYHRGVPGAEPYPWSIKPDKKLSVADVMALKRDHYEGTDFDMTKGADAGPFGLPLRWRPLYWKLENDDETEYAWERPISTQQTGFSVVTQSRSHLPDMVGGVCWYGVDDTYTTCYFPLYCQITEVPKPFATGSIEEFSWDSAWWVFNLVANYANLKFDRITPEIIKVQQELEADFLKLQLFLDEQIPRLVVDRLVLPQQEAYREAREYLTKTSVNAGEHVFSRWQRLAIEIFTKFNDGYIRADDGTYPREGDPYPNGWLRSVVEERPEQFKLPK